MAFVLGVCGTTALSYWRHDFVFTWPLSLFVLYQTTIDHAKLSRAATITDSPWRSRIAAATFLTGCVVFYALCRRLSLATEWAFMCGFLAAAPFSVARIWKTRRNSGQLIETALGVLEFSAYYWASVGVLIWRCQIVGS